MTTRSRPAVKLAVVVGFQFVLLLSVIGFKQYTSWTAETIVLRTEPIAADSLDPGSHITVRYEISSLDSRDLSGDYAPYGEAYVELREGDDGIWNAVAVHWQHDASFDDSELVKGEFQYAGGGRGYETYDVTYGIEDVRIPDEGISIPAGGEIALAVAVDVDRFGNVVGHRVVGAAP
jgi:uncharacterized membrane-anchored protein